MENELIEMYLESEINLLVELRMGNGLQQEEYEKLDNALTLLADEWKNRNHIPTNVVLPLVEIYEELYQFSIIYAPKEALLIRKAAENIKKLITKCMKVDGEIDPEKARVISKIQKKIEENGNFFMKLKDGQGIDEEQFEKIYQEIKSTYDEIFSWEAIPKAFVNILIDLYEIGLLFNHYKEELNQYEEADKIYEAHERIFLLIF